MNTCAAFENLLPAYLDGSLLPDDLRALEDHLASCEECTRFFRGAEGLDSAWTPEDGDLFARGILARTSGPGCESAIGRLCPFVDGELATEEEELISLHLEHCAGCREVLDCLRTLAEELPAFAEIDPGPAFTRAVLDHTSRRAGAHAGFPERIALWWKENLKRPRFALELAYSGAMVAFLLVGTPVSPFRDVPDRATAVLQVDPYAAARSVVEGDLRRSAGEGVRFLFGDAPGNIAGSIARSAAGLRQSAGVVEHSLGAGINELARGHFYEAWLILQAIRSEMTKAPANKKAETGTEPAGEGLRTSQ